MLFDFIYYAIEVLNVILNDKKYIHMYFIRYAVFTLLKSLEEKGKIPMHSMLYIYNIFYKNIFIVGNLV